MHNDPWLGWYDIRSKRNEYHSMLVDGIGEHGDDAISAFKAFLIEEWADQSKTFFWSASVKRHIALDLKRNGASLPWVKEVLLSIENTFLDGLDPAGKAEECSIQAKAWADLGDPEKARYWLQQVMMSLNGVGHRK